jgi:hypothetical protein
VVRLASCHDLTGDGFRDILYVVTAREPLVISSATGAIVASWPLEADYYPIGIRPGAPIDRDGDGDLEVLMSYMPSAVPFDALSRERAVYRWFGDGGPEGPLMSNSGLRSGWGPQGAPDLDGDGSADVIAPREDGLALVNGSTGELITTLTDPPPGPRQFFSAGPDADGDGRGDIVVRDLDTDALYFLYSSR